MRRRLAKADLCQKTVTPLATYVMPKRLGALLVAFAIVGPTALASTYFGNPKVVVRPGILGAPTLDSVAVDIDSLQLLGCSAQNPVIHAVNEALGMVPLDTGNASSGTYCQVRLVTDSELYLELTYQGQAVEFILDLDDVLVNVQSGPNIAGELHVNLGISSWLTTALLEEVTEDGLVIDDLHPDHAWVEAAARASVFAVPLN